MNSEPQSGEQVNLRFSEGQGGPPVYSLTWKPLGQGGNGLSHWPSSGETFRQVQAEKGPQPQPLSQVLFFLFCWCPPHGCSWVAFGVHWPPWFAHVPKAPHRHSELQV